MRADVGTARGSTAGRWSTRLALLWGFALLGWIALLAIEWYLSGPTTLGMTGMPGQLILLSRSTGMRDSSVNSICRPVGQLEKAPTDDHVGQGERERYPQQSPVPQDRRCEGRIGIGR